MFVSCCSGAHHPLSALAADAAAAAASAALARLSGFSGDFFHCLRTDEQSACKGRKVGGRDRVRRFERKDMHLYIHAESM